MLQPTHFIEVFKSGTWPKLVESPVQDIIKLAGNLKYTKSLATAETIAVWKIALKPAVVNVN